MLNAKKVPSSGQKFDRPDPLEPGTYPSRLVQVVNLGLQAQPPYKGEEKPPVMALHLTYELLDEFMLDEDGEEIKEKPRWLSETMPFHSLDSDLAKSTKRYFALDPEQELEGDWGKLIAKPCMVNITQSKPKDDVVYNNISGVSAMREKEAAKAPELVNPPKVFDFYEPDLEIFLSFPTYLQDKMKEGLDFEGSVLEKLLEAHSEGSEEEDEPTPKKKSKVSQKEAEEVEEEENW